MTQDLAQRALSARDPAPQELEPLRQVRSRAERAPLDHAIDSVREELGAATLHDGRERQRRRQLAGMFQLRRASDAHGSARVEHEGQSFTALRTPHAHPRAPEASEQLPVEIAQVLALAIGPMAREFDALTEEVNKAVLK